MALSSYAILAFCFLFQVWAEAAIPVTSIRFILFSFVFLLYKKLHLAALLHFLYNTLVLWGEVIVVFAL